MAGKGKGLECRVDEKSLAYREMMYAKRGAVCAMLYPMDDRGVFGGLRRGLQMYVLDLERMFGVYTELALELGVL